MNENIVTEKLAGKYFDIQRIDEHGVIHTVEKIKIKQSIRMYIIIASCGLKENNRTVYVQVRQAMYNTQFIPVNVQNYIKLTQVEQNSGKILSSVSNKLDYLIIGTKPTTKKVSKAKDLKVKLLFQKEFNDLLK